MSILKVICVDDTKQPTMIPPEKRVKKDEIYSVVRIVTMALTKDVGFELEEIDLKGCNLPYEYWQAKRFRPVTLSELEAEHATKELLKEILEPAI
jgi:hypothetical protein